MKFLLPAMIALPLTALPLTALAPWATTATPDPVDHTAAFQRLHQLEGRWVDASNPDQVLSVWRVTAGGTALTEHLFPGQPHEMLSVYHLVDGELHLTHYCMLGNQPQMKAGRYDGKELQWDFVGGTNLDPAKDHHVHSGVVRFEGEDRLSSTWEFWQDGKKDVAETFQLVRAED